MRLPLTILTSLTLASSLAAQTQATLQRRDPADQTEISTLRATARLVVVDVVVSDAKGHPIHGLKQSDFSLVEGKTPQTIASFEEHTSVDGATHLEAMPKLPPGVFTNYTPGPVNSAINILLLDALNTPMQDQSFVRQQMLEYLKKEKPGIRMAIFGLNTRLNMLQGFTADPEILRHVITGKGPVGSVLLDDVVGGNGVQDTMADQMADAGMSADVVANVANFEAQMQSFQLMLRARYTLDALNQLARYLSGIPGRKNLIWFSGSFPVNILPNADTPGDPFAGIADAEEEFRETTNLLARAQVAVYPIDARGLMVSPSFSAASSGSRYARNPSNFGRDQAAFFNKTSGEHSTMNVMAEDTGGKAFINTNGLADAVGKAVEAGSNYYTLTYNPVDPSNHGDFRPIHVKLAEAGYNLAYRRGYYADDPGKRSNGPDPASAEVSAGAPTSGDAVHQAAMFGGPPATQIVFTALLQPVTKLPETDPAPGNNPEAVGKTATKGPWIRYVVQFAAAPRSFTFTSSANGNRQGKIDFITLVYDAEGNRINSVMNNVSTTLTQAQFAGLQKQGILFQQQISVPVKGDYRVRILIDDVNTNRLGSLELPIAAVRNLPALPQPAAQPAPASDQKKDPVSPAANPTPAATVPPAKH